MCKQIDWTNEKCRFQTTVTFAGFQLFSDDYQVDSSSADAISNFSTPTNQIALWSSFALFSMHFHQCNIYHHYVLAPF